MVSELFVEDCWRQWTQCVIVPKRGLVSNMVYSEGRQWKMRIRMFQIVLQRALEFKLKHWKAARLDEVVAKGCNTIDHSMMLLNSPKFFDVWSRLSIHFEQVCNDTISGNIQKARNKLVELSVDFPQKQNHGTFFWISMENSWKTKPWNFPWKFQRMFHRDKFVELFCGNSTGNSTKTKLRNFLWNFHRTICSLRGWWY